MNIFVVIFIHFVLSVMMFFLAWKFVPHRITIKEIAVGVFLQILTVGIVTGSYTYFKGHDVMILNGQVTDKKQVKVSCSHSYQVCRGSGDNRTCSTRYRHSHDFDWVVFTSVGEIEIDRIDIQGKKEPKRWTSVKLGEPVSIQKSYFNPIKATDVSLFKQDVKDFPVQPNVSVYDYYRAMRVFNIASEYQPDIKALNDGLNDFLRTAGPVKKVNVVLYFHKDGPAFVSKIKAKQLGGRINDLVFLIDADSSGNVRNVDSYSWSRSKEPEAFFNTTVSSRGVVGGEQQLLDDIIKAVSYYQHRPIKEFDYLKDSVSTPLWLVIVCYMFTLTFPFIWTFFINRNYVFIDKRLHVLYNPLRKHKRR